MKAPRQKGRRCDVTSTLEGQFLVAMPRMTDKRFARSVVYVCAHSSEGAMGLIINPRATRISTSDLLSRLGIELRTSNDRVGSGINALPIRIGGPVETGRGFVLHSSDYYMEDSTLKIENGVCLTATIDVLRAIANGSGPERALLALGYSGWSPGQLETEIQANGWLNCPADSDIIFDGDIESKYVRALGKIGVDVSRLVNEAGHA
jgi:putative transcriptional regulator